MSLIHETPVFQLAYDLLKEIHLSRKTFDKSEKYTLGERLENSALDLLLRIIEAGQLKHEWKITAIDNALLATEKIKILLRLATELKQVHERRSIAMQETVQKAGRMLGGWRRSL